MSDTTVIIECHSECRSCKTSLVNGFGGVPYRHHPNCVLLTKYSGQVKLIKWRRHHEKGPIGRAWDRLLDRVFGPIYKLS